MAKSKCKKCGYKMNIPRSYADICYDCTYNNPNKKVYI